MNDKGVVDGDRRVSRYALIIGRNNSNFCDLHAPSISEKPNGDGFEEEGY
jgi:hypothetical protein